ncbi:MAG: exo-alpha-sialidase [Alloprevotella sp.]|nr:exo-alpha-sialidase [Alloprevotella sp.]
MNPTHSSLWHRTSRFVALFIAATACMVAVAQPIVLFGNTPAGYPVRIPAIAQHRDGALLAFAGSLKCGTDIGFGRCDILVRTSNDQGQTWSEPAEVICGTGSPDIRTDGRIYDDFTYGFGDIAVVCDDETGSVLALCAAGGVAWPFSEVTSGLDKVLRCGQFRGKPDASGRWTWFPPEDISATVYGLIPASAKAAFVGSGKLCQSRRIKAGTHRRIYAPFCTRNGNYVLYSDDFGHSWKPLGHGAGGAQLAIAGGDEPKCEELPNGDVLLSSRKAHGRYYNIFKYQDIESASGSWQDAADSDSFADGLHLGGNACNGEVLIVDAVRNADSRPVALLLQSLPAADTRAEVSIAYKELPDRPTPADIAAHWPTENVCRITSRTSAYSTMCVQHNGTIAFYYEENYTQQVKIGDGYDLVYRNLTLNEITRGAYRMK